jgi:FkbM family methyltransferase
MEVGVWNPEHTVVRGWIETGCRATLVEPDPEAVARLRRSFGHRPAVTIVEAAVAPSAGTVRLLRRGPSTFLADQKIAPAIVNDGYRPTERDLITVRAVRTDEVDDGSVDLLVADVEGAEWYVLDHLVSRPVVISVETHGGRYRNPFLADILHWMSEEGYVPWYLDRSDTVFVLADRIRVVWSDHLALPAGRAARSLKRFRKSVRMLLSGRRNAQTPSF